MSKIRVGDSDRVRGAIREFLEKMKACDAAIPEELAEDALEMAEEVRDALCAEVEDEEADVLEITKDRKGKDEEEIEAKMEDTMTRVLMKHGLIKDSSMRALDELEEELKAKETDEDLNTLDADGEEKVTVDPESVNDSGAAVRAMLREMKPIIASVKDSRVRKRLVDSVVKAARMATNDSQYAGILTATKKSAQDAMKDVRLKAADADTDFGMSVAERFNPHYKKEG